MKLCIQNIGKVNNAAIEINGITVIAGENNTGKGAVGKVLFAVFNSFYDSVQRIRDGRIGSIENRLVMSYKSIGEFYNVEYGLFELAEEIVNNTENKIFSEQELKEKIWKIIINYDEKLL